MSKPKVIVIGAGLAGSLLAIYLARRGLRVEVYERRPDMRRQEISAGRSINLALSLRGIVPLQQVGLADKILAHAIPMRGRMIHSPEGELTFQPYGSRPEEVINSVSRGELNCLLMDGAESFSEVSLHFNQRCTGMDFKTGEVRLYDLERRENRVVKGDTVIACDGSGSALRLSMQKSRRFNLNQLYLEHGYKELSIPAGEGGAFRMEKNALHIWPRGSFMLIALPNLDGSFTCTLFFPFEGRNSFATLNSDARVSRFFEETFPDALPLMPTLLPDFRENPTGSLITIKCFPWHVGGKMLLLGDSAHAVVPFYGQGMNCAFEDCLVLNECIERHGTDWGTVFTEYQSLRKENADAIADLAMENFIEMRDTVADPHFLMKKKLELLLEEKFPGRFRSKYAMVTFQRIPYSQAMRRGRKQDEILMELCRAAESLDKLDPAEVLARVEKECADL